ncbi:MAG: hypothetical protein GY841_14835 [FCB group bacterium]|nr:hypothetical protein [FCB group bacterium]
MELNIQKNISAGLILKLIHPVIVIYGIFFALRLGGLQPPSEASMGDFISAIYFIFGASVAYLLFVMKAMGFLQQRKPTGYWWLGLFYLLLYLAYDEIFMIHEWVCYWLGMRDIYLFMLYGAFLSWLVFVIRRIISKPVYILLAGFVFLAAVAVLSDTFLGEGEITLFGRVFDFEQLSESLSALSLAIAFLTMAINELRSHMGVKPVESISDAQPSSHITAK